MKRTVALVVLFFFPMTVSAVQILPSCADEGSCQASDFVALFVNLYQLGLELLAPVALLFFIIGGIILLTAAGYQERVKRGQQILSQVTAGVIIVLLSWVIIDTMIFTLTGDTQRTVFGSPWYQGSIWNPECAPIFREGCIDDGVRTLQTSLVALGYSVGGGGVDGRFGPDTTSAVRTFQSDYNAVLQPRACNACPGFELLPSLMVWREIFNRSYGVVCGPAEPIGPLGEWGLVWCGVPACSVTSQEANQKRLITDGTADEKTQEALATLQPVAQYYRDACLTE